MRHIYVTALLFGLLIFQPVLSGIATNFVFLGVLTLTGWLLPASSRRVMIGVVALAILAVGIDICESTGSFHVSSVAALPGRLVVTAVIVCILLYCAGSILWALLKAEEVCMDVVVASVNFYLILGFIWAHIYSLLTEYSPGAFLAATSGEGLSLKFIYFSFVTMTTLGYGDVVPQTPMAQTLACVEAIIGQLYVPVVVAYLLSLHTGRKLESEKEDGEERLP